MSQSHLQPDNLSHPPTGRRKTGGNARSGPTRRTGIQLERKRMQDRESQRNVRERTKKYIASLEQKLAELESPTYIADLLNQNEELRRKVDLLESTIEAIVHIAKKNSTTEHNIENSKKNYQPPLVNHARSDQPPVSQAASPNPPTLCPRTHAPEEILSRQQDCVVQYTSEPAADEGVDQISDIHTEPGRVNGGETEGTMINFSNDFEQTDFAPLQQIPTLMSVMDRSILDSLRSPELTITSNTLNSNQEHCTADQFPDLVTINNFSLSSDSLWLERKFPTPQNCAASNIWDTKLVKCISDHSARLDEFSKTMPEDPELQIMLDPNANPATADPLTCFLKGPITQWNFELPELLAIFWLNFIHLRYRIDPSEETFNELPSWFHPCPLQYQVSHPIYIDALPWPHLREKLIFEHRLYPFHQLAPIFCSSLNINWPHNFSMAYVREASGAFRLSSDFKKHLRKLENWSLKPAFADSYPELTWVVTIK